MAEPPFVDQETEDDASLVLTPSSFFSRLDDIFGYDPAVGASDLFLFQLAWDALLDQVSKLECDFGDIGRWNR